MKIVAMLAWWDEPPRDLYACVKSLRVLCDAVFAVDGAYAMTPGATARSADEQADTIRKAAADSGLDHTVVTPTEVWTGQVEKRDFMLREAARDADWVLAVDCDHRLVGDRDKIRAELARVASYADSIRHDFHTPMPANPADLDRLSPHPWHTKLAGKTIEHSLLLRCLDDMRVEQVHWGYSGRIGKKRVALGNWRSPDLPQGRYHRLQAPFCVDHVCFARDRMRLDRNRAYCAKRDRFKGDNGFEP